jgi:uncharacterized protein YbaP (TraB family)
MVRKNFFFEKKKQKTFALFFWLICQANPARAEPAIWIVQSPTAKIYLFGTMHLLPKHTDWFGPQITAAFNDSTTLFEEADIGMVQPQVMSQIMNEAVSPDTDIFHMLSSKSAAKFTQLVHSCHLPQNVVAHFRPWFAAMLPTVCQLMQDGGGDLGSKAGPEGTLIARAKQSGKKIDFFETAQEQIGYLANAPEKVQIAQLEQAIDEADDTSLDKMETAWTSGDVAAIAKIIAKGRQDDETTYQTIFVHRNEHFAARIADLLHSQGTVFIAIGAGHLAGPDSVQALLAKRGFTSRRL